MDEKGKLSSSAGQAHGAVGAACDRRLRVGLQLYSVREALLYDVRWALSEVAAAGYHLVEGWHYNPEEIRGLRYRGMSVEELAAFAAGVGLRFVGAQVGGLTLATAPEVITFCRALGCEQITIPIGYYPSEEALRAKAREYNRIGELAQEQGLRLHYVNHYHEFQLFGGRRILDLLLGNTDPELLTLTFNPYWAMRGLVPPLGVLRQYAARIGAIEQQDFPLSEIDKLNVWRFGLHHPLGRKIQWELPVPEGEIENLHPLQYAMFCEIGEGILQLRDIVHAAQEIDNVRVILLRQDFTRKHSEFESVKVSRDNYSRINGLSWNDDSPALASIGGTN